MPGLTPRPVDVEPFTGEVPAFRVDAVMLDVVTISGQSGTLKSSVAKALARNMGIGLRQRGEELRSQIRNVTGQELLGSVPDGFADDDVLDARTRADIQRAHSDGPVVIEGRLAGVMLADERARLAATGKEDTLRSLSVLVLSGNEEKRVHRITKRQQSKGPLAVELMATQTRERHVHDVRRWQERYPHLLGTHEPFDPALESVTGDTVYDLGLIIDHQPDALELSSGPTKHALIHAVMSELTDRGLIALGHQKEGGNNV